MGMYDHFEPVPALHCPKCDAELHGWQSKPEGCNQFLWQQGVAAPASHAVDKQWQWSRERLDALRLPEPEFEIYVSCSCREWVVADCRCVDSIWVETRLRKEKSDDHDA